MPTKSERTTVAKLMLMVANLIDPSRKEQPYAEGEPHPEYTIEELRPLAAEAMKEAEEMLRSWG